MNPFANWDEAKVREHNARVQPANRIPTNDVLKDVKLVDRNETKTHTPLPNTEQRQLAPQLGGGDAREAQGPRCPVVRFILCRNRLLDVDAKYSSVKDLLDGLQQAGLIHSDREGEITLEVQQVKVSRKQERTDIEIEYPV